MTELNEEQQGPKYNKDDYTLEQLEAMVEEETEQWNTLGISLNNLQFGGSELFFMQCKVQALTNCIIEGTLDQENLNKNLKVIILESMEDFREGIEPQVRQARIEQLRRGIVPRMSMPWEKPNGR